MPEIIPDHVPSPRTLLAWDGTVYRPVSIDAAGQLQIDVLGNANLDGALQSVATDRLIVRGEDQLFSFKEPLHLSIRVEDVAAGDRYLALGPPLAGELWIVTNAAMVNLDTVNSRIEFRYTQLDWRGRVKGLLTPPVNQGLHWTGRLFVSGATLLYGWFYGCVLNDEIQFTLDGYVMSLET